MDQEGRNKPSDEDFGDLENFEEHGTGPGKSHEDFEWESPEIQTLDLETVESDPGFARRRKKKRRKKHYFLRFIILCLIVGGAYLFFTSERFDIVNIEVRGNQHLSQKAILKKAKLKKGQNLVKLRRGELTGRIMKSPYVKDCKVSKDYPATLIIDVEERIHAGVIPYGDRYALIDAEGILIAVKDKRPKVTQIAGVKIKKMRPGEKIEVDKSKRLEKSLDFLKAMRKDELIFRRIYVRKDGSIRIQVYKKLKAEGKFKVIKNQIENGNFKLVLNDLQKKGKNTGSLRFIDDRFCSYNPNYKK